MNKHTPQTPAAQVPTGLVLEPYLTDLPVTVDIFNDLLEIKFPSRLRSNDKIDPRFQTIDIQTGELTRNNATKKAVHGLSQKSRYNLRQLVAKVNWKRALWLTLTYHQMDPTAREVKQDLDIWIKRLSREFSGFSYIWKIELTDAQKWHIHLLVFDMPEPSAQAIRKLTGSYKFDNTASVIEKYRRDYAKRHKREFKPRNYKKNWISAFQLYVSRTWHEVTQEATVEHLAFGTNVEIVNNPKHLQAYISKYVSKVIDQELPEEHTGRIWGKSENLNTAFIDCYCISYENAAKLRQFLLAWLKQQGAWGISYAERLTEVGEAYGAFSMKLIGSGIYDGYGEVLRYVAKLSYGC